MLVAGFVVGEKVVGVAGATLGDSLKFSVWAKRAVT